jgi:hypothetical protein
MQKCKSIVQNSRKYRMPESTTIPDHPSRLYLWFKRLSHISGPSTPSDSEEKPQPSSKKHHAGTHKERQDASRKLGVDMIRRMDDAPRLVDPNGWISSAMPSDSPLQDRSDKPQTPLPAEESPMFGGYETCPGSEEGDDSPSTSLERHVAPGSILPR